jgi:hypothetical protein
MSNDNANVPMMTPADFVNLIQRSAVELARVLDAPSEQLTIDHVIEHIARMVDFAKRAKEMIEARKKAEAA